MAQVEITFQLPRGNNVSQIPAYHSGSAFIESVSFPQTAPLARIFGFDGATVWGFQPGCRG